eukprot:scaffold1646_cov384-Prasinococcus_capsulatus_cf.AAC.7
MRMSVSHSFDGVTPDLALLVRRYMSCGSTSKAVNDCPDEPQYDIRTTHRLSEVLPEFLKHDYNSHGPGLVSVRSLFWDLHRLLDYDEASLRFYDSMDEYVPIHSATQTHRFSTLHEVT